MRKTQYAISGSADAWSVLAKNPVELAYKLSKHYEERIAIPYEVRLDLEDIGHLTGHGVVLERDSWIVCDSLRLRPVRPS